MFPTWQKTPNQSEIFWARRDEFLRGPTQQDAFEKLKKELTSTPVFAHYEPARKTVLSADASSYGLGVVLLQEQENGARKPVAYASRSMTSTKQRYAQIEKEALATTWASEKFNDSHPGKRHPHRERPQAFGAAVWLEKLG